MKFSKGDMVKIIPTVNRYGQLNQPELKEYFNCIGVIESVPTWAKKIPGREGWFTSKVLIYEVFIKSDNKRVFVAEESLEAT